MKILSPITLLLTLLIVLTTSCKKDGYDQPNAACILTHSEDDLFGYSFDIVYNSAGDPASIDFAGFPATMEYDAMGRLSKANFGTEGVATEFVYSNNTFLPTVRKYIRPDFGGLASIDSFSYNILGQLTKRVVQNLLFGGTYIYKYQYDNRANLKNVTLATIINGIESSPSLRFEGLQYDNKYNALSGNQWLKYLFDLSDFNDYYFLQLSVNNALNWKWYFSDAFPYYSDVYSYKFTSGLNYNPQGFANTRNGIFYDTDGVTELGPFNQLNTSSCDAPAPRLNQQTSIFKTRNTHKGDILHLPYANKKY
jgi:hypothetical protein